LHDNQVKAPGNNMFLPVEVQAVNEEERAKLEKELKELDAQIAQYEQQLKTTQTEKTTLQNTINKLKAKASSISLQIKSSQGNLTQIKGRIQDTQLAINQTMSNIERNKQELAALLQTLYQYKSSSDLEILLANESFQEYFDRNNNINILQDKIKIKLQDMQALKTTLTEQKQDLDDQKDSTQKLLSVQLLQQQELDKTKKEQEQLLSTTKGKEATYQQILSEARKKAAEIRSRIYELVGVKSKVTFGEALDIAN
jgi:septal ring factor EnvC (AmiA/AmiB activator)